MVPLLLKSLNKIGWKRVGAIGAAGAFVLMIIYCYLQHVALKQNQLIYQNPAVVERVKTVRVEGPDAEPVQGDGDLVASLPLTAGLDGDGLLLVMPAHQ